MAAPMPAGGGATLPSWPPGLNDVRLISPSMFEAFAGSFKQGKHADVPIDIEMNQCERGGRLASMTERSATAPAELRSRRRTVIRAHVRRRAEGRFIHSASPGTRRRFSPMPRRARRLPSACRARAGGRSRAPRPSRPACRCRCDATSSSSERPPLRSRSLICSQISPSVLPSHAISRGARCHSGWPGTRPGSKLAVLVADGAAHGREAMTVRAALDRRLVQPALLALARAVAGRMAVHAARMGQHLAELGEQRRRPRRRVADRGEALRRREPVRRRRRKRRTRSACSSAGPRPRRGA